MREKFFESGKLLWKYLGDTACQNKGEKCHNVRIIIKSSLKLAVEQGMECALTSASGTIEARDKVNQAFGHPPGLCRIDQGIRGNKDTCSRNCHIKFLPSCQRNFHQLIPALIR